jgi:hypothetical protein
MSAGVYKLLVDGIEADVVTLAAPATSFSFTVNTKGMVQGYKRLDVIGPPGENAPAWFAYRLPAGEAVKWPATMPAVTGTYDLTHPISGMVPTHVYANVPAKFSPTVLRG